MRPGHRCSREPRLEAVDGFKGRSHEQNIQHDVLLIIVTRECILGINYSYSTNFIGKFLKINLAACLQKVEAEKAQCCLLIWELFIHTHAHLHAPHTHVHIAHMGGTHTACTHACTPTCTHRPHAHTTHMCTCHIGHTHAHVVCTHHMCSHPHPHAHTQAHTLEHCTSAQGSTRSRPQPLSLLLPLPLTPRPPRLPCSQDWS